MNKKLYVITPIFNPWRYNSRIALYKNFVEYMRPFEERGEVELHTIEIAFRDRPFTVTDPNNCKHIQLRSEYELWLKECSINVAMQRLPQDWEYVAWIDADIQFARPDWAKEAVQLLQHYDWLQMFSQAIDLSPNFEVIKQHQGIVSAWMDNKFNKTKTDYLNKHPGFAFCARRDALDKVGGLYDFSLLGAGDRNMVTALMGNYRISVPDGMSAGYYESLDLWQSRADRWIKGNIGFMPGMIMHYWHGKKVDRKYVDRWKILARHQYDPELDVYRDTTGLYRLTERNLDFHYDLRNYFASRHEDSIDL